MNAVPGCAPLPSAWILDLMTRVNIAANGACPNAALVIRARRIARTAWSMYTYKTEFDLTRLTKSLP